MIISDAMHYHHYECDGRIPYARNLSVIFQIKDSSINRD